MAVWFAAPYEYFPHYRTRTPVINGATNADANFPATNLFTYDPTQVFRTTTGSTVITVNLNSGGEGGDSFYNVVSLINTNASYRATLVIEESNGGVSYTQIYSGPLWANLSGAQSATITNPTSDTDPRRHSIRRNHSLFHRTTMPGMTHLRLTIADPVVTNLTFGRLFIGRKFQPTYGIQYGSSFNFTDFGKSDRTERGVLLLESTRAIVNAAVKMDFLTKTDMYDYAYEFNLFLGATREVLACLDDTDQARLQKNLLYCTISEGRTISFDTYNTHSQTWMLESIA